MASKKKLSRRSFLSAVAGVAATAGMMGAGTVTARAQGYTDSDYGTNADPVGGGNPNAYTDSDYGVGADAINHGAGTGTDQDYGTYADAINRGQNGVTDSDYGTYADPAGRGRGN